MRWMWSSRVSARGYVIANGSELLVYVTGQLRNAMGNEDIIPKNDQSLDGLRYGPVPVGTCFSPSDTHNAVNFTVQHQQFRAESQLNHWLSMAQVSYPKYEPNLSQIQFCNSFSDPDTCIQGLNAKKLTTFGCMRLSMWFLDWMDLFLR